MFVFIYLFIYFFFLAAPRHIAFLGQGSDPSHSCNLSQIFGNARYLSRCARPGIEPSSQCSQDAANPVAPQQELLNCIWNKYIFLIEVELMYPIVFVSDVQKSDSARHTNICIRLYSFFILSHYSFLQDIVYSSLCYTVNPCCLSL